MSELYRYTVLRRGTTGSSQAPEPYPGDASVLRETETDPWGPDRLPDREFLEVLAGTIEPPNVKSRAQPLLEALEERVHGNADEAVAALAGAVTGDRLDSVRAGLGALIEIGLAERPQSDAALAVVVQHVVNLRTLDGSVTDGGISDDKLAWSSSRSRPLLRRRPAKASADSHDPDAPEIRERLEAIAATVTALNATGGSVFSRLERIREAPLGSEVLARLGDTEFSEASIRDIELDLAAEANSLAAMVGIPQRPHTPPTASPVWVAAGLWATAHQPGRHLAELWPWSFPEAEDSGPSRLTPVGTQDLIVVRTRLLGYRLAEISRIENIAGGETRRRHHNIETELETTFFEEREIEQETTESLATTTKDELRNEVETLTKERLELEGKVHATYRGPVEVEVEASASMSRERQRTMNTTRNHAVEVTEEASARVRDRIMTRTERRVRRLVSESNDHEFKNETTAGSSFSYYWLQKVERAALFNYGRRLMYELVIPEPAAHLRHLSKAAPAPPTQAKPPPTAVFNELMAKSLAELETEWESGLIDRNFSVDVEPKPVASWVEVVFNVEKDTNGSDNFTGTSKDLSVPAGYEATDLRATIQTWEEGDPSLVPRISIDVAGCHMWAQADTLDGDSQPVTGRTRQALWTWGSNLNPDTWQQGPSTDDPVPPAITFDTASPKPIPAGLYKTTVVADDFGALTATVGLYATPTNTAIEAWRRSILSAVVADYWRQYDTWAAQALAEDISEGGLLEGLTDAQSAELRQIERDEVKRSALGVIRNRDPMGVSPVGPNGPNVSGWARDNTDLANELLFLEQAFEWQHMNFVLYGYYWSDPVDWPLQVFGVRGGDRPFREFLKSGAARVQLPVRPGFEGFVEDYMMDGIVWSGGPRPEMGSAGYVDFITELAEQMGIPADEVPVCEETDDGWIPVVWDVQTPTDLVILRTWEDQAGVPLERWIPPQAVPSEPSEDGTVACPDPLQGWTMGTGAVPDDPEES